MRLCLVLLFAPIVILSAEDPYAMQLFQKHCAGCHQSEAGANGRIPQLAVLKTMTPSAIQKTLDHSCPN
jgi:cytochrome c2